MRRQVKSTLPILDRRLRRGRAASVCAAGSALALLCAPAAYAGLGEPSTSAALDHAAMQGRLSVTTAQTFDVQKIVGVGGQTVREYATRSGTIFAVTWSGTRTPDLKLLLGAYFDRYVAAAKLHRTGHHLVSIRTPDLVLTVTRFQRAAFGQAYLPALMPGGVTPAELR